MSCVQFPQKSLNTFVNKKELFLVEEKLLVGNLCFGTFSEKADYFFGFLQK